MEFFDRRLDIGEFFNGNPFVFFTWESFPVDQIVNSISHAFGVNDVFHFCFFYARYNLRGRWRCLFLRWEIALMIWVE